MPRAKVNPSVRFLCILESCDNTQLHRDEVKRHTINAHPRFNWALHIRDFRINAIASDTDVLFARVGHDNCDGRPCSLTTTMTSTAGRGQRQKKPTDKIKELVGEDPIEAHQDQNRKEPPIYFADYVKASAEVKEVEKIYNHTKVTPTGEKYDLYQLGGHLENKDKRVYIRAKQDPETMYFHAAEAPPCHARISDEGHNLCQADKIENAFSKDMLTKTGEAGQHTTRANVFAREGQFFWEAKVVSTSPSANKDNRGVALQTVQIQDKTSCERGTVRVGFARREQSMAHPLGDQGYSYAVRTSLNKFGSVTFRGGFRSIIGKEYHHPKTGDVIGLMITLPSLEIHDQVVKGTYNPADHPELSYGPKALKEIKKKPAGGKKNTAKPKSANAKGKEKAELDMPEPEHQRDLIRKQLYEARGINIPPTLDILRDRNPFAFKNNLVYFECPDYTPRPDLVHTATRGRSINPETGTPWETLTDSHPCHELPWLRTLPGSRIQVWVNGEYLGIAYEHLLAFLPPASHIEKSAKASLLYGDVDDGMLGYYPAITHYGGGTVECNFDGPWWFGYDKEAFPDARPFGERYKEQIVEDFVSDMVDEICLEAKHGQGYVKAMVESSRAPAAAAAAGMSTFTGHGLQSSAPK